MDSREYAAILQATADHLLNRPKVELDNEPLVFIHFCDKEAFVKVCRAMGTGTKEFCSDDLHFRPEGTCIVLSIGRDKVCRKVQEAKWECEPILSAQEVEALGVNLSAPSDEDIPF